MHYQLQQEQFVALDDKENLVARIGFKPINQGRTLVVESTYVIPRLRGNNVAVDLTVAFLKEVAKNHKTIMPLCPYTQAYLNRHPKAKVLLYKAAATKSQK